MVNTTIYVDESEIKRRLGALADQSGKVIARAANASSATAKKPLLEKPAGIT